MDDATPIPYHFEARDYQKPFLRAVEASVNGESPIRNFMQVWHRRSGKDKVDIADATPRRLIKDPCLVKWVYPTLVMGRENLWDGIGSDGFRYRDHIPEDMRSGSPNETLMKMPIINGSLFQIGGSDKPDSLRGGNPKMFVFSEWSEQDPYAWDVVEPILKENGGISIFNMTPKGDNHARALFEYAKNSPLWHVELLTAEDTKIWTPAQLEGIRMDIIQRFTAAGRSESEAQAYFDQEYMCSFTSPVIGSYYGAAISQAEREGRVTGVPYDKAVGVYTFWDLGIDDSTTIWFVQAIGRELHLIDYYENSGEGLPHYAKVCQEREYTYIKHYGPHDIEVRELGSGKSRREIAKSLGLKFEVAPALGVEDGIEAARSIFSRCWFDSKKTYRGIQALKNYHKEWDERNKTFKNKPKHDWSSHGADAFRTFAVSYKDQIVRNITPVGGQTNGPWGGVSPIIEGIG